MKQAVENLAEVLAEGLGLEKSFFTNAGKYGNHLLAPTATNLAKYGEYHRLVKYFEYSSVTSG